LNSTGGKSSLDFKYLIKNLISFMGLFGMACFGLALLIRVTLDVAGMLKDKGPYEDLATYIMLPGLFTTSVGFTLFGMYLKWRRTRAQGPQGIMPGATPPRRWLALFAAAAVTAGWLMLSVFGTYRAYQYSDSTAFCGLACHQVMAPEYTAYKNSVHAHVACVECHIGPGADWFVKSKLTGMHQLWAVSVHSYKTPIKTPLRDLRPAQETCEQCHWPGRFSGSVERVDTHYATDEQNTPTRYNLLMKVGGGHAEQGLATGVHWHVSTDWTVKYLPLDEKRQEIPYVRVIYNKENGRTEEFFAPGFDRSSVSAAALRTMDCLDCHNRPSHIFRTPNRALDEALDKGLISPALPAIKRTALEAIKGAYKTTPEALAAIDAALDNYAKAHTLDAQQLKLLAQAREQIKHIYSINFFPEQGVDYRAYINNLGHFEYKGCDRCHDGKHKNADKSKAINRNCDNCHLIIGQASGVKEVAQMAYQEAKFEHPDEPVNQNKACSSCHGIEKDEKK
jgi:hypothetical protein